MGTVEGLCSFIPYQPQQAKLNSGNSQTLNRTKAPEIMQAAAISEQVIGRRVQQGPSEAISKVRA